MYVVLVPKIRYNNRRPPDISMHKFKRKRRPKMRVKKLKSDLT